MSKQLALTIPIYEHTSLNDFCWQHNILLKQQLDLMLAGKGERLLYVWGYSGSGKSHLLQGFCQAYHEHHQRASVIYLPLHILKEWGPESIEGLTEPSVIAIDNIDAVAGLPDWEESIFHLYNQVYDSEHRILLISNHQTPIGSGIQLADLHSRLSWGLVMHLQGLNDEQKVLALQQKAQERGFYLSNAVAQFLINRCPREFHDLQYLLNRLDHESLAARRKITIPFVKLILGI